MKLSMDEVLKVPYKCCCLSARSAQGRIQGGDKLGHGGPLLQRTSSSDWKATATNQMHSSDLGKKCCYFLVSFGSLHLSRRLFLYFNYLVSVTAGGPRSPRGHM